MRFSLIVAFILPLVSFAQPATPGQRSGRAPYYPRKTPPPAKDAARSATTKRGPTLATAGDESLHVQACQNCHGPGGTGFGNLVPYLAGLDAKYLDAALHEW